MESESLSHSLIRIISGGQTGVDRGALDAAISLGIEHGGWCPRGRLAEDGKIPSRYKLKETESAKYRVRTEKNVVDSDGTLILFDKELRGGTELTHLLAIKHCKPYLPIDLQSNPDPTESRSWASEYEIQTLNVAGPRESSSPGIADLAREFVTAMLQ